MLRKLLFGVILLVLIGGLFGTISCGSGDDDGKAPASNGTQIPKEKPESGVIEITAQDLISQLLANPNKYKRGTVIRVSGVVNEKGRHSYTYYSRGLGPMVKGYTVLCEVIFINRQGDYTEEYLQLRGLRAGDQVIIQGNFDYVSNARKAIILGSSKLISKQ